MELISTLIVPVTGAREASCPPTWGQLSIWQWHGVPDGGDIHFTNGQIHKIRVPYTLEQVTSGIAWVFGRHDALRTVLEVGTQPTRQVIEGSGSVRVEVYETGGEDGHKVAEEIAGQLTGPRWNGRQWPLRIAVIVAGGRPAYLATAFYRLVIEVHSIDVVVEEVFRHARGEVTDLPPRWQSVDEVRYENSPEGQAVSDRALASWRDVLSTAAPSMVDFPRPPQAGQRYALLSMESPAMARACYMLRRRWRVPNATLIIAAMAVAFGQYTGHGEVVLQMITSNRGDRNRRHMIGTLTATGLLRIDLAGQSFEQIARQSFRAASAAGRNGYCDPGAISAARDELRLLRGADLDVSLYFNDMQTGLDDLEDEPELTEDELCRLAATAEAGAGTSTSDSTPDWPGWATDLSSSTSRQDVRAMVMLTHGRQMPVVLYCDTSYVGRAAMRELLSGMERVLVAAACQSPAAADPRRACGIGAVARGAAWVRHEGGWVDLDATSRLWREVAGDGEVRSEEPAGTAGRPRLVGYAWGAVPPSFGDLHRAFVDALTGRADVHAPDLYRWIAAPPADPGDQAAWAQVPVLTQADGR